MIQLLIRWFFHLLCSFYLYRKLLNLKAPSRSQKLIYWGIFLILSVVLSFLEEYFFYIIKPAFILCGVLILKITTKSRLSIIFPSFVISYGFSFLALLIADIMIVLSLAPFFYGCYDLPDNLIQLTTGILQFILAHLPFHIRRLQKGMPFLYQTGNSYIGILISFLILFAIIIKDTVLFYSIPAFFFLMSSILLFGLILFFWWRSRITADYRMKLRQAELLSLKKELAEKNERIAELEENNDALAKIIHKDNKLIPAMEMAVCEYLDTGSNATVEELARKSEELTAQLKSMSHDRKGILSEYRKNGNALPSSGVCVLDALFSYMQKKAEESRIDFHLYLEGDLATMTENIISADDLSHVLSDLIENAIIATKTHEVSETAEKTPSTSPSASTATFSRRYPSISAAHRITTHLKYPITVLLLKFNSFRTWDRRSTPHTKKPAEAASDLWTSGS